MKAFKNWRDKNILKKGGDNSHLRYPEASKVWRAALEWIGREMSSLYSEQTGKVIIS